ncbi:MAG: cytochrome c3 family protein [bacterium]|nr:cytochrome c3 family protein [bacterium]OHE23055.1 MAG: hypothetical protein A2Z43_08150 [Syntrophobacterales bacterium RBG_19FT_COMBO_59_10]
MGNKFWRILIVSVCIVCFVTSGVAFAQKKAGERDVKYESKTAGAVLFSHEKHMKVPNTKCNACHTKIFKMKKEAAITKEDHSGDKFCAAAVCHDGKKSFGMKAEADCAKCHKK